MRVRARQRVPPPVSPVPRVHADPRGGLLRPLLIGGTTFFLIPWYKITNKNGMSFITFVLSTIVVFTPILILLDLWNNPKGFRWSEHFSSALIAYGSVIGLFTAVLAIAFLTLSVVAPSLKILLDIFRYIGSQEYRAKIQTYLNGVIKWVSVDRERAKYITLPLSSIRITTR